MPPEYELPSLLDSPLVRKKGFTHLGTFYTPPFGPFLCSLALPVLLLLCTWLLTGQFQSEVTAKKARDVPSGRLRTLGREAVARVNFKLWTLARTWLLS